MSIVTDPDLDDLSAEQKKTLLETRLRNVSSQLMEALLNRQLVRQGPADEATRARELQQVERQVEVFRTAVKIHRVELEALAEVDAAPPATGS